MAYEALLDPITFPASTADLSLNQYAFATISTAGQVQLASTGARGTFQPMGVLLDKTTAGGSARIALWGISKLQCGDSSGSMPTAIVFGTPLVSSSVGRGVASTATGQHIGAYALANLAVTAAAGTIIPALIIQGGLSS